MRSELRASSGAESTVALARATAAAALLGFAATLAVFYPGLLSQDSVSQLEQGRRDSYEVWHPPLLSWLLGRFDAVLSGTGGVCLLHAAMLWGALALLARECFRDRRAAALAVLGAGLFPPVFTLSGVIWKDTGMGAAMLLAAALLLRVERGGSRAALLGVLPALAYAAALRHNAPIALLPICVWIGVIVARRADGSSPRLAWASAYAVGFFVLLVLGARAPEALLVDDHGPPPVQQILAHDVAAVSIAENRMRLPAAWIDPIGELTIEELRSLYTPTDVGILFWGDGKRLPLRPPGDLAALREAWRTAVSENPVAYLRHRAVVFGWMMGRYGTCDVLSTRFDVPQPPPLWPGLADFTHAAIQRLAEVGLYHAWIYVLLCTALPVLLFLRGDRRRGAALALAVSGVGYAAAYLFIGTGCSFRFVWWTVLVAVVLCFLALSPRRATE